MKRVTSVVTRDGRNVLLRPLARKDLPVLLEFARKISAEKRQDRDFGIVSLDGTPSSAEEREFLEKTLDGMSKKSLVSVAAFCGKELVGHCDVHFRRLKDVSHTGVLGIIVAKDFRSVGVGEALMRRALEDSAAWGVWLVELTVFSTNARARHLYTKLGFRETGVIPKKILREGRFTDEVQMFIHLPHKR